MWGGYFFSFGISSKNFLDEPVHHKQLILSVWKLMNNPVDKKPVQKSILCTRDFKNQMQLFILRLWVLAQYKEQILK